MNKLDAAMVNSASSNFTPTQEKDRRLSGEGCVIYMLYAAALATPRATVDSVISPVQGTGYAFIRTAPLYHTLVHVSAPDQRSSRAEAAGAARDAVTRATSAAAGVALWLK